MIVHFENLKKKIAKNKLIVFSQPDGLLNILPVCAVLISFQQNQDHRQNFSKTVANVLCMVGLKVGNGN